MASRTYKAKRKKWRELPREKWWIEGAIFEGKENSYIITNVKVTDEWEDSEIGADVIGYLVDPETICQDTGLTDKNGRKIFEGDIVAWRREDIILTGHYTYCFSGYKYGDELIVRCLESGFMLCRKNDGLPDVPNANDKIDNYAFWNYHKFLEVIGNIFDNPELIGE